MGETGSVEASAPAETSASTETIAGVEPVEVSAPEATEPGAVAEDDPEAADIDPEQETLDLLAMQKLEDEVVEALREVFDPEIPVNIYELGLIYDVNIDEKGHAEVIMTLTTPNCPVAGEMPGEVEMKVLSVEGVQSAKVNLVFDPPWTPDMMSEAAQLELGFF